MLAVGVKAPEFISVDQNGQEIRLSQFKGKKVILYFYPKDNTPGCTKQACGFGANYTYFLEKGVVILGVSKDSVASHKKFESNYNIPFPLISDVELKIISAYDVWKKKSLYGKSFMGVERTTYLIDEEGIIQKVFSKVKAGTNPTDMLKEI